MAAWSAVSPALERLLEREDPGVGDEEVLLEVAHGLEEGLDGLRGPLDHVLERRDALEQMLVEGDLLRGLSGLLDDADAREDEELGVAGGAVLVLVRVPQPADLAIHGFQLSADSFQPDQSTSRPAVS